MQITLISILNGWLAGIILLFLSLPVSGAGTFCDGLMGPGTWREVDRLLSSTAQEDFTIVGLKEAIRAYVKFENSSSRAGGKGAQRLFARNWR
ncbi:MAG: hypothetical protein COT74_12610, partial [Bdellovibrionales bacterium CG10_big_fil_rev_8_21_14_0_10_45_34]